MNKNELNKHIVAIFRSVDALNNELGNDELPKLDKGQKIILRSALIALHNIAAEGGINIHVDTRPKTL